MDKGARDVEMAEPEEVHPLQQQFEDTEDLIATYNASSSPEEAIAALQKIIGYGTIFAVICCGWHLDGRGQPLL